MFMDDLKLYVEGKFELEQMVRVAEEISGAVGMEFGLEKCAVAHMRNGRTRRGGGVDLGGQAKIGELDRNGTYKYLGVTEMFGSSQTSLVWCAGTEPI